MLNYIASANAVLNQANVFKDTDQLDIQALLDAADDEEVLLRAEADEEEAAELEAREIDLNAGAPKSYLAAAYQ